ncbi:hypothetical protein FH972_012081 [Carpinus fangiana]|uniref:phospholipase D n=1 Tax=Carpinus fangiana TaxID=176857 RepID=A0A5N6R2R3_9ROSI|nr:hypothetical protein FH972_012081 [Carpinus fangiana]
MDHFASAGSLSFGGSDHVLSQEAVPFQTNKASLKFCLLHGNLDIWVREAKNLPNMVQRNLGDMFSKLNGKHKRLGGVVSKLPKVGTKIEEHMSKTMISDPYVVVSVSGAVIGRTFVISNSENPVWMQHYNVPVAHSAAEVHFVVKDDDVVGSRIIGAVGIPVEQLCSGMKIEGSFPILSDSGEPCKAGAVLSLSIQYIPVEKDMNLYHGVPDTYFPLRRGGKVTLYQDAHVHDQDHDGCLPNLKLDGDVQYEHRDCWHDIYEAISQAQSLIYIAGWSVCHMVRLIRDGNGATGCMLGDLLKAKSKKGVRVLLLVWDDPSSISIAGYKVREGIMKTKDEETRHFFKHTLVQVQLCPRPPGKNHSWDEYQITEYRKLIYSHHQKTVIVDADAGDSKRKIVAFIGGLDLCIGRYDTPNHPLFRTLQTVHKDDYNNPTFKEPAVGCPRQPWHDLHSRIDGPAACDILTNFKERWLRASKQHHDAQHKFESYYADIINGMRDIPSQSHNDPEDWHVQVFRSIDSISVEGFPMDPKGATEKNLVCRKDVRIDMSIHTAYVNAIRAAQKFIYIENQFFLGSSFNWDSHKDIANERFSAYIVIPMRPEGDPTSPTIQQILYWQVNHMISSYKSTIRFINQYEQIIVISIG